MIERKPFVKECYKELFNEKDTYIAIQREVNNTSINILYDKVKPISTITVINHRIVDFVDIFKTKDIEELLLNSNKYRCPRIVNNSICVTDNTSNSMLIFKVYSIKEMIDKCEEYVTEANKMINTNNSSINELFRVKMLMN